MKLLAVVAIGVTALIGSPTTGAAKSAFSSYYCEHIFKGDENSWYTVQEYRDRIDHLAEKLIEAAQERRDTDELDEVITRLTGEKAGYVKVAADYAQIYSTFCK